MSAKWLLILTAMAVVPMAPAAAQSEDLFEPERIGRWYMTGAVGGYSEENNAQLAHHEGSFGLAIGGGYRLSAHVALEIDGLVSHQKFDTPVTIPAPALGAYESRSDLVTSGAGGLLKIFVPVGRVELYAGGGLGLYTTTFRVEGTFLNSVTEITERDTAIGYQALIGADVLLSRHVSIGLEYRKFKLDVDFGSLIPGKLEMGGDFFFATVRGHF
jgi:opacity protein-like surface antigen